MKARASKPRFIALLGLMMVVVGVAVAIFNLKHAQGTANEIGAWVEPFEPSPQLSDEYNQMAAWVINDVARMQTPWTVEIAERFVGVLDKAYSEQYIEEVATKPGATYADQEPLMLHGYVEAVAAERLRRNEPIEPEARRMLVEALLRELDHPHWRIRHSAVKVVCYSRLIEDPAIRARIEAMFDDPHSYVAANARKQLNHYDEYEALMAGKKQ